VPVSYGGWPLSFCASKLQESCSEDPGLASYALKSYPDPTSQAKMGMRKGERVRGTERERER
jgi:hypothetical protein